MWSGVFKASISSIITSDHKGAACQKTAQLTQKHNQVHLWDKMVQRDMSDPPHS